jgi:hypothetical protein
MAHIARPDACASVAQGGRIVGGVGATEPEGDQRLAAACLVRNRPAAGAGRQCQRRGRRGDREPSGGGIHRNPPSLGRRTPRTIVQETGAVPQLGQFSNASGVWVIATTCVPSASIVQRSSVWPAPNALP